MKKLINLALLLLFTLSASAQLMIAPIEGEELVSHKSYDLSYNEDCEQANWVSYMSTKTRLENPVIKRKNYFKSDPLVSTESAHPKDYYKSGYDRGHLAPAADMLWDTVSMKESFYMSNMLPQVPGFNRGVWKKLENNVREFTKEHDTVYVLTGPALLENLDSIGFNYVCVAKYNWKIIYTWDGLGTYTIICYLLPNEKSDKPLSDFLVPISIIEEKTGYDFYIK